jgi:hypothetical protein
MMQGGTLSDDVAAAGSAGAVLLQMHKEVPPPRAWRPLVIRHQAFVARVYVAADKQSLSSKSCIQRPGMHDMGAVSGYRSSRATSNMTTGSASNASYGTADQQQQQQDDAGSKPGVQKGTVGADGAVMQANGIKQEQPTVLTGQQQQQQQVGEGQAQLLQPKVEQQQDSDELLLIAPAAAQQEPPLIGVGMGGSGAELLMTDGHAAMAAAAAAAPMHTR